MRVIILAQGQGSRLKEALGDQPKQLVDVGGWSVLERTCWMVSGGPRVTVIGPPAFKEANLHGAEIVTLDAPGLCVLQGLEQTAWLWDAERTVVLLGDVVFSMACLKTLFLTDDRCLFAGTSKVLKTGNGEIFGVSIRGDWRSQVLKTMVNRPCTDHDQREQPGHLRLLLYGLQRLDGACTFEVVEDFTDDLDYPKDLDELRSWRAGAAHLDLLDALGLMPPEVGMAQRAWEVLYRRRLPPTY